MTTIIDNLLPDIFYKRLKDTLNDGTSFPWFWDYRTASDVGGYALDDNFMFSHVLYFSDDGFKSPYFETFSPILYFLDKHTSCKRLIRMKLNLYTNQNKKIIHARHTDINDENGQPYKDITTTVFNFNTCNGGTIIGDKEYLSKENQALLFNNQIEHQGFTQTDNTRRIVLNIATSNDR